MDNLKRMYDLACNEIGDIADRGLNMSTLETTYKLIDVMKDIKTIWAMEDKNYHSEYDDMTSDTTQSAYKPHLGTLSEIDEYLSTVKNWVLKMTFNASAEDKNRIRQHLADILSSF